MSVVAFVLGFIIVTLFFVIAAAEAIRRDDGMIELPELPDPLEEEFRQLEDAVAARKRREEEEKFHSWWLEEISSGDPKRITFAAAAEHNRRRRQEFEVRDSVVRRYIQRAARNLSWIELP